MRTHQGNAFFFFVHQPFGRSNPCFFCERITRCVVRLLVSDGVCVESERECRSNDDLVFLTMAVSIDSIALAFLKLVTSMLLATTKLFR